MKKKTILSLVLALMLLSVPISAKEIEFIGGATYNTFKIIQTLDGEEQDLYEKESEEEKYREEAEQGSGFYLGGRYHFNNKLAVEMGFDKAKSVYSGTFLGPQALLDLIVPQDYLNTNKAIDKKSTEDFNGPYAQIVYKVNKNLKLKTGAAYYFLEESAIIKGENNKEFFNEVTAKAEGLGFLLSGEISCSITKSLFLSGDLGYRIINFKAKEIYDFAEEKLADTDKDIKLDMSGLRAGINFSYKF